MQTKLEWKKRCKKAENLTSDLKHWETRCGCYRVTWSQIRYGKNNKDKTKRFSARWYAMRLTQNGWRTISHHSSRNPAFKAVEAYHKKISK